MKTTHIALVLFAVLATSALCEDALLGTSGGFYVRSNSGKSNCILQQLYNVAADGATLGQQYKTQSVQPATALPEGCYAMDYVFTSFFKGETLSADGKLVPVASSNGLVYNAVFNASKLQANNGTGCVLLSQTSRAGVAQYLCSLNYDGVPLYLAVWGTGNFVFDTSSSSQNAWIKNIQNSMITGANSLVYTLNTSFPNIIVDLKPFCGSSSNVISALTSLVTVTTTTNMTASLSGVKLAYTLIKRNNATAAGDYLAVPSNSMTALFTPGSGNGCWSMAVSYSDILPDMAYCAGGCKVSFIVKDNNNGVYVLQTTGLTTSSGSGANRLRSLRRL